MKVQTARNVVTAMLMAEVMVIALVGAYADQDWVKLAAMVNFIIGGFANMIWFYNIPQTSK